MGQSSPSIIREYKRMKILAAIWAPFQLVIDAFKEGHRLQLEDNRSINQPINDAVPTMKAAGPKIKIRASMETEAEYRKRMRMCAACGVKLTANDIHYGGEACGACAAHSFNNTPGLPVQATGMEDLRIDEGGILDDPHCSDSHDDERPGDRVAWADIGTIADDIQDEAANSDD